MASIDDVKRLNESDGGRVYPLVFTSCGSEFVNLGLSIRDYFAAQAINGLVSEYGTIHFVDDEVATRAYSIADAMLAARERK